MVKTDMTNKGMTGSRLELGWQAEAIRLRELSLRAAGTQVSADKAPMSAQDSAAPLWLLERAASLGEASSLREPIHQRVQQARLLFALLCLLALLSGASAALGFFGSEVRQVNVIWTLLGLIGVHLLALLLWLLSGRFSGGLFGRVWFWLLTRLPGTWKRGEDDGLARALINLMGRRRMGQWLFASITHSLWLLALSASLLTILFALSLRSYGFVLETTILGEDVFHALVQAIGWLPAQLGFALPDADMVASALATGQAQQAEDARRAWASWLCGAIVVYAILPRFLVWVYSLGQLLHSRHALLPDPALPGYHELFPAPASARGVVDAAPAGMPRWRIHDKHPVAGSARVLMALELGQDLPWPPALLREAMDVELLIPEVVETREQRQMALNRVQQAQPLRLLLACDARLSPDRGTLHWLVALSGHCGALGVWLLVPQGQEDAGRAGVWQDSLAGIGLAQADVVHQPSDALNWLRHHD